MTFDRGNTYIFDLSDSSNSNHPLAFKDGSNSYTTGVTTTGTAGSAGAQVQIDVDNSAPSPLRYYCTVHGNAMGNTINVVNSNLALVASNITNVNNVGSDITNVNLVAGSITNVDTVATNLTDVNAFAETYFIGATQPSNPTVGDLWFDESSDTMKVYGSGGFQNAGSSVNGTTNRYQYLVGTTSGSYTGSTTVFPATYDSGYVDVYRNGIKLVVGASNDFVATNGTSITLNSAATTGDTIDIVGYGTFTLNATTLDDLSGVSVASPSSGQFLKYDGTNWVSDNVPAGVGGTNGVDFDDNVKARFGTGNDLEIYHDGSNSFIDDSGTGNLQIRGNSQVKIQKYTGENMFVGIADGASSMYYDNSQKIATTSTGVDVTGTTVTDKVQVESAGGGDFVAKFQNETAATPYGVWIKEPASAANGYPSFQITDNAGTGTRFRIDSGTGAIYASGAWADAPAGTVINTELFTNSTYITVANSNTWTNVWTFNYTPKLNGSKLFLNFSVNTLPEGSNGHNFWLGMYSNSAFSGNVLGQQYWYEISRAAGTTGWTQDQHIMQTYFNTNLGQGNTAYFLLQFQNGTATGTSYWNYSNAFSSLIITEVAS